MLLTRKQHAHLIDIIYDHTDVLSLFDGDLGFCDARKHSIPTTMDKPVYLPHRQIPIQLQSEVRKIDTLGSYAGRVMVSDKKQPICIPAGMSKVVVGRTQEKLPRGSDMVEATNDDILPFGISVNHTYVSPTKSRHVSVILLNTNTYNMWIRQPLYAATIWDVECEPIFTKAIDSNTVEIKLQEVPLEDL